MIARLGLQAPMPPKVSKEEEEEAKPMLAWIGGQWEKSWSTQLQRGVQLSLPLSVQLSLPFQGLSD